MSHSNNQTISQDEASADCLLQGFRHHYHRLESAIQTAIQSGTDSGRLSRMGDDLDEYIQLVQQVLIDFIKVLELIKLSDCQLYY